MTSEALLAEISELAARYFCGWAPKEVGKRRFPVFEEQVRRALATARGEEGA